MKHFFAVIFAFTALQASSQKLYKNEVDEFTGAATVITERYVVAKGIGNLSIQVGRLNDSYFMWVYSSKDLGCSGASGNYIILKFTDGSTVKLTDHSDIDCADFSSSLFIFNLSDFDGKFVQKIRLKRSKFYDDFEWTDKWCEYTFTDFLTAIK
jgi:hypothetical protein